MMTVKLETIMTVLSHDTTGQSAHASLAARARRDDPEPHLDELLDDPVLLLLMARDGVDRAALDRTIAGARHHLIGQSKALFDAIIYAECRAT